MWNGKSRGLKRRKVKYRMEHMKVTHTDELKVETERLLGIIISNIISDMNIAIEYLWPSCSISMSSTLLLSVLILLLLIYLCCSSIFNSNILKSEGNF